MQDTFVSSAPSLWTLASAAMWAGRQVGPSLCHAGTKLVDVSVGILSVPVGVKPEGSDESQ